MTTNRMMLKRMMVTVLMMLITVSAMSAEQKIWLSITGKGKVVVTTDKDPKNPLNFSEGMSTVTDVEGQMITISLEPESGYTVTSVTAQLTTNAENANTRRTDVDASFLDVKKASDTEYTFEMPKDFNVKISVTFESSGKGGPTRNTDYPETYFIRSESANKNTPGDYYLCPTKKWYLYKDKDSYENDTDDDDDNGNPFLTTYQCKDGVYDVSKAVWAIVKHPTEENCYYIIQAKTGRYLVSNGQIGTDANRMRVHLESVDDETALSNLGDLALFEITSHEQHVDIVPHSSDGRNGEYEYLVVNFKNFNELKGSAGKGGGPNGTYGTNTAGIIGLYNQEENHKWFLEETPVRPTITDNSDGTFTISAASGSTIYYTTDGTIPTTSTPTTGITSVTVTQTGNITVIKAIAKGESDFSPSKVTTFDLPRCEKPVITVSGGIVTISCATEGASIHYTTNGDPATSSSTAYNAPFAKGEATTIKAIATKSGYANSIEAVLLPPEEVSSSEEITDMSGNYILTSNFSSSSSIGTSDKPFRGTIDGNLIPLALGCPLVAYAKDATIKNVILDNVSISGGTNVGAICNEASGDTRIYNCGVLASNSTANTDGDGYTYLTNCSSTISGTNYVGSIVGLLDDNSRVINCFSYANVSGGSEVGGIVGHNNVVTTASNLKTMVMNCMFYGEVSGTSIAPIYNGEIITNVDENKGVSNFNYFRLEASYIQNTDITKVYNCALGAETRFLQRFEFFRYLLNSNREMAAWWATGDVANKEDMMKWVMEPTQIGTSTPYPILKTPDKYASVVNYTPDETPYDEENRNKGRKLGTLAVTIQNGTGGAGGASITTPSLNLTITDKDYEHFNFNYGKVQLPYYNEVGTNNYTDGKVVTGWKIVSITGGTAGSYSTGADVTYTEGVLTDTPYNFADRKCTNKDLYGTGGANRIFSQGAYWDVPEGVTAITIQPYWGKAVYLSDAYYDVVYNTGMTTAYPVKTVGDGQHYTNGESKFNDQLVYTSMDNAVNALNPSATVYDNAVVLVGNYHEYSGSGKTIRSGKPYTITSVDLDDDNEPDYSFMWRFDGRTKLHPVRYDFLNVIGLGMAQKSTGGTGSYNFGIPQPLDWFEVTNTALFRVTQFEYSPDNRSKKPIILQGGVIEQLVTQQSDAGDRVSYFHVGGNAWFKEFHRGSHQDNANKSTPHPPVSVTGGDYNKFYLTGLYQSQAKIYDDNAECYINGGRFGEMAGAGMEGIGTSDGKGNITWVIDNADIKEFYGGGINFAKPVHGNIHTIISNSHVNQFCGGPKFGDMESGRTVITTATDCTFGTYFGAGFGGNSYNRFAPPNRNNVINLPGSGKVNNVQQNLNSWNEWVRSQYTQSYSSTYGGVSTQIDYQFIPMSSNVENVARLFVEFVGFSLATCRNVTSTLTGCKITGNFYGGGSLGKVEGPVTSTLTDCEVQGSVFGAGFSASLPSVEVDQIGFETEPYYYTDLGTYRKGEKGSTTTYNWQKKTGELWVDNDNHILYTNEDLTTLGTVTGNATLTIAGRTTVAKSVYGGGEESAVNGNTNVIMNDGIVMGSVFGGGQKGITLGKVDVEMTGGTVEQDIYGGGALADTNKGNWDENNNEWATNQKSAKYPTNVILKGGTISGNVYGGGLGQMEIQAKEAVAPEGEEGQEGYIPGKPAVEYVAGIAAKVFGDVTVKLNENNGEPKENGEGNKPNTDNCKVKGSIFGCNNLNGTPMGDVTVHVYKTVGYDDAHKKSDNKNNTTYDLAAVYGGGNLAAYEPYGGINTTYSTHVIIDGCGLTSIQTVYGGGNAASTPATNVTVNGTHEIGELFGGGNGMDAVVKDGVTKPNPGANVGYKDYSEYYQDGDVWKVRDKADADTKEERLASAYCYGTGKASVNVFGGTIHRVFGGSNTKGNVRQTAVTLLNENSGCDFCVDEAYGGGKSAPMDAEAKLLMSCIPGLTAAYGGAEAADIMGDVTLNITNGTFNRVFGGNNKSGTISGSITVNIEEIGCKPIIIGELYGGGNLAGYSVYGYNSDGSLKESGTTPLYKDPQVNVMSFTSIGNIYGGGYGAGAKMVGNPIVNVNVAEGAWKDYVGDTSHYDEQGYNYDEQGYKGETLTIKDEIGTHNIAVPSHTKGKIGAINNVFGGGNAAMVKGNTNVNICTLSEVYVVKTFTVGASVSGYYTRNTDGTYTAATGTATADATYYEKKDVLGADIRGNVYGGGNEAEVTGDTNVVIGKQQTTEQQTTEPEQQTP